LSPYSNWLGVFQEVFLMGILDAIPDLGFN